VLPRSEQCDGANLIREVGHAAEVGGFGSPELGPGFQVALYVFPKGLAFWGQAHKFLLLVVAVLHKLDQADPAFSPF
jgi:hypothetical protein